MPVYTKTPTYVVDTVPIYYGNGRYSHAVKCISPTVWRAERKNCNKYRLTRKQSGDLASAAAAVAWCESDMALIRPTGITATTTTSGFTQPAVGSTVVVPVASATGYIVDMSVDIATAGRYQITAVAGLNITLRNTGGAGNVAPTTAVTTGKAVTAVAGPG